jgi:hypothetical protein
MKKLALSVLVVLGACGGGDDGMPTTTNTASAGTTVTQTANVRGAVASMDGNTASASVQNLGGAAQNIIQPASAGRTVPAFVLEAMERTTAAPGPDVLFAVGTCTCDASGCTFVGCGDDLGTWTIDGTLGKSGDTYTFDLDMTLDTEGISWDWHYEGEITATATLISGHLEGNGSGVIEQQGGYTYSNDWSVDYNDIGLDGSGCATSGSVSASGNYVIEGGAGGGHWSGSATITFGPNCGDATAS